MFEIRLLQVFGVQHTGAKKTMGSRDKIVEGLVTRNFPVLQFSSYTISEVNESDPRSNELHQ